MENGGGNRQTRDEVDEAHPLLRGGQPSPKHRFSDSQMEVLRAVCDALFPSLRSASEPNDEQFPNASDTEKVAKASLGVLEDYFTLSGAEAGIPEEVAGRMCSMLRRSHIRLMDLILRLLSFRVGTLILGGRYSLSSSFPFVSNFANLPLSARERMLLSWRDSSLQKYQELFRFFKSFICWIIFTKVDGNGQSPIHSAIGYKVPDPIISSKSATMDGKCREEAMRKPLEGKVIEMDEKLGAALQRFGFTVLDDFSHLKGLRRDRTASKDTATSKRVEFGVRCDAVVLGSGSGGSVIAARLAEAGYKVLILEKGGYFARGDLSLLEGPSMYAMYEEGGCLVSEDSNIFFLAGSTVGGGSTVNWSASFRTPEHVRREWAMEHKLELFRSCEYEEAMDAVCKRLGVQQEVEGENFQNSVLRQGCQKLGYHVDTIPRNSPPHHPCGFCGLGCPTGSKRGGPETWLIDAVARGALVVTHSLALEILHHRGRAVGTVAVAAADPSSVRLFVEAHAVVAACGALHTPILLRRSSIHNPHIGRHLHIHPVQAVWGGFPEGRGPHGASYQGGIMTAYSRQAGDWTGTGYGTLLQCPAIQPGLAAIGLPWASGEAFKSLMRKMGRTAFLVAILRDEDGGCVDADQDGRLIVSYKLSPAAKRRLDHGGQLGMEILAAAGASEIGTFNSNAETIHIDDYPPPTPQWLSFLQNTSANSYHKLSTTVVSAHQMGSCRMGYHPSTSVVQMTGETWEVSGLFVGDSSVFPTATGVNPMITVQSIAYCTSQSILRFLESQS